MNFAMGFAQLSLKCWNSRHSRPTTIGSALRDSGATANPEQEARYGLGASLVERALIDAVCRLTGGTFRTVLANETLGFAPERLHPELAGWPHVRVLSGRPPDTMRVRHTVGLLDELSGSEALSEDADSRGPNDGFPVTLREDIGTYGLDLFKIKVGGDQDEDVDRLEAIAGVLGEAVGESYEVTLDGNEQFDDLGQLVSTLDRLAERPCGRELVERILYIEQPLARVHSFDKRRLRDLSRLRAYGEIILDEADAEIESFREAVGLGYRGVSVKNCKGVFRAFANRGLCDLQEGLFQSSEDLTNMPLLPLQQDLATAATLGLTHSERNGHHYFRGLDHLPAADVDAALERHPDLYSRVKGARAAGTACLKIDGGRISLSSIHRAGYGSDLELDMESRIKSPRLDWKCMADRSGSQV